MIANSPKLTPKSTVGTFESIFFFARSFIVNHPILFVLILIVSIVGATLLARARGRRAGRGGILGVTNGSNGFFHLDGKEGLLTGGSTGKVD